MSTKELKAFYTGKKAASEKYLLTAPLLNMEVEKAEAIRQRDMSQHDHEILYWNGQIEWIEECLKSI